MRAQSQRAATIWPQEKRIPRGEQIGNLQDRYIKCIGAIIPSAPYFFITSNLTITLSSIFSITALFVVGATVAVVSSKNVFWGALRMSMAGGAAAAVTFAIGNLIGTSIIS